MSDNFKLVVFLFHLQTQDLSPKTQNVPLITNKRKLKQSGLCVLVLVDSHMNSVYSDLVDEVKSIGEFY